MIIAKPSGDYIPNLFSEYEVLPADKYIKRIIKNAEYYAVVKGNKTIGTLIFHPYKKKSIKNEEDEEDEEDNGRYVDNREFYYLINGKKYSETYSNNYKDLVRFYEDYDKKKPEQLTLF